MTARLTKGKTRKSDLRLNNIKQHIALYSTPKNSAPTIEEIARDTGLSIDQVKKSVANLVAAGLLKPSDIKRIKKGDLT